MYCKRLHFSKRYLDIRQWCMDTFGDGGIHTWQWNIVHDRLIIFLYKEEYAIITKLRWSGYIEAQD